MRALLMIAIHTATIAGLLLFCAIPMGVLEVYAYGYTSTGTKTLVLTACMAGYGAGFLLFLYGGLGYLRLTEGFETGDTL